MPFQEIGNHIINAPPVVNRIHKEKDRNERADHFSTRPIPIDGPFELLLDDDDDELDDVLCVENSFTTCRSINSNSINRADGAISCWSEDSIMFQQQASSKLWMCRLCNEYDIVDLKDHKNSSIHQSYQQHVVVIGTSAAAATSVWTPQYNATKDCFSLCPHRWTTRRLVSATMITTNTVTRPQCRAVKLRPSLHLDSDIERTDSKDLDCEDDDVTLLATNDKDRMAAAAAAATLSMQQRRSQWASISPNEANYSWSCDDCNIHGLKASAYWQHCLTEEHMAKVGVVAVVSTPTSVAVVSSAAATLSPVAGSTTDTEEADVVVPEIDGDVETMVIYSMVETTTQVCAASSDSNPHPPLIDNVSTGTNDSGELQKKKASAARVVRFQDLAPQDDSQEACSTEIKNDVPFVAATETTESTLETAALTVDDSKTCGLLDLVPATAQLVPLDGSLPDDGVTDLNTVTTIAPTICDSPPSETESTEDLSLENVTTVLEPAALDDHVDSPVGRSASDSTTRDDNVVSNDDATDDVVVPTTTEASLPNVPTKLYTLDELKDLVRFISRNNGTTTCTDKDDDTWTCSLCQITNLATHQVKSHCLNEKHCALVQRTRQLTALESFVSRNEHDAHWTCTLCHVTNLQEHSVQSHCLGKKHAAAYNDQMTQTAAPPAGLAVDDKENVIESPPSGRATTDVPANEGGNWGGETSKASSSRNVDARFQFISKLNDVEWSCRLCRVDLKTKDVEPHCLGKRHAAAMAAVPLPPTPQTSATAASSETTADSNLLSSPSWPKLQRRPSVDVILAILGDVEHEGQHHTANKQPPHLYHSDELHTILEGLLMEHGGNAASLPFPRAESPLLNMRQVVDDNSTSSSYGSECQSLAELVGDDFLDDLETTMEEFTENLSQDFDRLMQEVAVL